MDEKNAAETSGQPNPWERWACELQAIAQTGLRYTHDKYDIERYERIRELACECMTELAGVPIERTRTAFASEEGYQTPKLATRVAVFDGEGRVCLVHETDGGWILPGGWVDWDQTVFTNSVKETREEAGLEVEPVRLIALHEHNLHQLQNRYYTNVSTAYVECRLLGGVFVPNIETDDMGFFGRDKLPDPLSLNKMSREELLMCFAAHDAGMDWQVSCE